MWIIQLKILTRITGVNNYLQLIGHSAFATFERTQAVHC